jgi:hypothetical protein
VRRPHASNPHHGWETAPGDGTRGARRTWRSQHRCRAMHPMHITDGRQPPRAEETTGAARARDTRGAARARDDWRRMGRPGGGPERPGVCATKARPSGGWPTGPRTSR